MCEEINWVKETIGSEFFFSEIPARFGQKLRNITKTNSESFDRGFPLFVLATCFCFEF